MLKKSDRDAIIENLIRSLRTERIRQALSLNEVATRSGLSHTMVMRVEKGERMPTIDTLLRITGALSVDLAGLMQRAIKDAKGA